MTKRVGITCGKPNGARRYAEAVEAVGLEPVVIAPPAWRSLAELQVDGLLLGGGTDVDPSLYGEELRKESQEPDRRRDRMERHLLREALRRDLPVLGICRGLQFFTVYHGGALYQHLERHAAHRVRTADPSLPVHDVIVQPGTRLAAILGAGRWPVNSRHHQGAARVPGRLLISARALDGLVEAVERRDKRFALAVQWHPEDQVRTDPRQRRLFEAFRKALEGSL